MDYIIDFKEIVEQAPAEEPARQYYFMDRVRELVEMKKQEGYAAHCMVEVMGCQMSAKDGEKLLGILERCGYTVTEDDRDADVTWTIHSSQKLKPGEQMTIYIDPKQLITFQRKEVLSA